MLAALGVLAALNLLGAVGGGLARLGLWPVPPAGPGGAVALGAHGAVMMAGFFGTVIALERAAALRRGYWVPAAAGLGGVLGWTLGVGWPSQALWIASAAGLMGLYAWAARHRAASLPLWVEGSGALALLVGTVGWSLGDPDLARLGWSAFLVLTIAGERRELMRMVKVPRWSGQAFLAGWGLCGMALVLAAAQRPVEAQALWWGVMGLLSLWLLRFDIARHQWRAPGWAGHTAICLLVGYAWLLVAAVLGLAGSVAGGTASAAGPAATAAWHALWLGFVWAMVFGHAPIMLPALAGWRPRPTRWALLPLAILGASVALRVAGTLWPQTGLMAPAGAGHALALVVFAAVMLRAVRAQTRAGPV